MWHIFAVSNKSERLQHFLIGVILCKSESVLCVYFLSKAMFERFQVQVVLMVDF